MLIYPALACSFVCRVQKEISNVSVHNCVKTTSFPLASDTAGPIWVRQHNKKKSVAASQT